MRNRSIALLAVVAVAAFFLGQVSAQDKPAEQPGQGMPAWMQAGEQHKELAKTAGTWDVKGEVHLMGQVSQFDAVAKREMVMGGKFLTEMFTSTLDGRPFQGHLLQGYDTVRKQLVSVWADNMSPVMSISRGNATEGGKIVMRSEDPDMITGKLGKVKTVIEPAGNDKMTFTAYRITDNGEQLFMKLAYTRRK